MDYLQSFERSVDCFGDKPALIEAGGRSVTYEELDRRSTALANATTDAIPGSRCATLALNGIPTVETMIAGQKRGKANVQLSFRAGKDELVDMYETADARGLVFDDACVESALHLVENADVDFAVHAGSADVDHEAVEDYEVVVAAADGEDVAADNDTNEYGVFYTSGTTSKPKACLFDQEQMWHGSTQVIMELSIQPVDVALVTTPWYHMVTTDAWILPHLQAGATMVIQQSFDPEAALELIERHDVTGLLAVPTQLDTLADLQADLDLDVDTLDYIRTGGSIVNADLVERASEYLTENVFNTYGLTEGGPNLTWAHHSVQDEHIGSIGKESYMWDLRVVESTPPDVLPDPEAEVEPGETGEILARGPGMGTGYIDNPEEQEMLFVDGWLRTYDVADVDEDGYLYIVDRVDNMIISGGENVYPQEVEQALLTHAAVEDVAVVGLEDDHWGHVVACVISTADGVTEEELDQYCKDLEDLADFKRPRRYVITEDDLPRTDTGTLQRQRVIDTYFDDE